MTLDRMRARFWLGAFFITGSILSAQTAPSCKGPVELERSLAAKPSTDAYNAKGAYFAEKKQLSCAIAAFESAIRLDPNSADSHFNLALALREKRDLKRAAKELQTAVRLKPDMVAAHNALGTTLLETEQSGAAEGEFQAALKLEPDSLYALDGLSKALIQQKRYLAAIGYLRKAPPDPGLQINLSVALSKNGNTEEAIAILQALIKADPGLAEGHSNLAVIYAMQNRFRESADEYYQALRHDAGNDTARISLVRALVILAEFNDALPFIEDYLKRHASDGEGLTLRGTIYRGLGDYVKAEADLRRGVQLKPEDYDARYNLGFVLAKLAKPQEALPHLEKARQLRPDSTEARFQLASVLKMLKQDDRARIEFAAVGEQKNRSVHENVAGMKSNQANALLQSGETAKAIELYREVLREDPSYARGYYNLAQALARAGDRPAERQALEQALALDSKLAAVHTALGLLDLQDRKPAQAQQRFKSALALDPQDAEAQTSLGVLYSQQGKTKEAEEALRKAALDNPKYAPAFLNLGLLLAGQGKLAEAEKQVESAVALAPGDARALTAMGMLQSRQGRNAQATETFRKVIALSPKSAEAHLNLGMAQADQFNLEGALAEFTEAAQLSPDLAAAHYFKGRSLFDLRRNEEARPEVEAAVRLSPDYASALYLLALIEKQANNPQRSAELLRRVIAVEPRNSDALYMLGQNLARLDRPAEAVAQWKRALETNPGHAEALYNLSRALAETDPSAADQYRQQFRDLQQKRQITDRAETLGNFALAAAAARDWDQALAQLKEALEICGACRSRGDLHKNLGIILCMSGDLKNGASELQEARKIKPDDPDIEQALRFVSEARQRR